MKCYECNKEVQGLNKVNDFRGNTFSVCCDTCYAKAQKMLNKLFTKYGGIKNKCSCFNSPHIESMDHLKHALNTH